MYHLPNLQTTQSKCHSTFKPHHLQAVVPKHYQPTAFPNHFQTTLPLSHNNFIANAIALAMHIPEFLGLRFWRSTDVLLLSSNINKLSPESKASPLMYEYPHHNSGVASLNSTNGTAIRRWEFKRAKLAMLSVWEEWRTLHPINHRSTSHSWASANWVDKVQLFQRKPSPSYLGSCCMISEIRFLANTRLGIKSTSCMTWTQILLKFCSSVYFAGILLLLFLYFPLLFEIFLN